MLGQRALFLDRDGVINHDPGYTYNFEDFVFIDGIFDLCRAAIKLNYLIIVVTNQAGIGRGFYTVQDFLALTECMCQRFKEEGAAITEVYYCPYHPEFGIGHYKQDSFNRKPNPGMLLEARAKYGIEMKHSMIVGDKDSDMQAGVNASVGKRCQFIPEKSGKSPSEAATHVVTSLQDVIPLLA